MSPTGHLSVENIHSMKTAYAVFHFVYDYAEIVQHLSCHLGALQYTSIVIKEMH